jgi:chitodextrinase
MFAIPSTCLLVALCGLAPLPSAGAAPKNLRVTAVTDWTVGLRWDAPSGRAPDSYVVQCSTGHSITVPGSQTAVTFAGGFSFLRTYSFRAYAVRSGSWSGASNSVPATLLRDTTPPTQPVVSATGAGPTHVDLAWSCIDGDPTLRFDVYVDGVLRHGQVAGNAKVMVFLRPGTGYTFHVRARDSGGNWSPTSNAFVVTTPAADPNDHAPPTTPSFWGGLIDPTEVMINFGDSTDNVTLPGFLEYHLYLNDVFEDATVGIYPHRFHMYMTVGIVNTIELFARDEAGNWSVAATMEIDMR